MLLVSSTVFRWSHYNFINNSFHLMSILCQWQLQTVLIFQLIPWLLVSLQEQFYSSKSFCHYNMFNHYFFRGAEACSAYKKFLSHTTAEEIILVMDPPFGGLVEVIIHTIRRIMADWSCDLNGMCVSTIVPSKWLYLYSQMIDRIFNHSLSQFIF